MEEQAEIGWCEAREGVYVAVYRGRLAGVLYWDPEARPGEIINEDYAPAVFPPSWSLVFWDRPADQLLVAQDGSAPAFEDLDAAKHIAGDLLGAAIVDRWNY
jgi:hypothetical protein